MFTPYQQDMGNAMEAINSHKVTIAKVKDVAKTIVEQSGGAVLSNVSDQESKIVSVVEKLLDVMSHWVRYLLKC